MKKVFIVGTGIMGLGITQIFLEKGFEVLVFSLNEKKKEIFLEKLKYIFIKKAKYSIEMTELIMRKLEITMKLEDSKEYGLVIEAITEDMEKKKEIFRKLDNICSKDTIFASNTSTLSITEMSFVTSRADRFIGLHFFNPVSLMKLVEIVKGLGTSTETSIKIEKIIKLLNKEHVHVEEEPGFIVNRLLIPMINEAINLVEKKVATIEDIDKSMMLGANHPIGPLALSDLIGNDIVLKIMEILYEETYDTKYRPSYLLKKYVRGNKLGRKSGVGFYKYL